tara:strand:- start:4673 stop:4939 length:267 start_codon:yes stop_codon:yes gene_type:complete
VVVAQLKNKFMVTQEILENVEKALNEIRPFLESDGGNIKLLSIEDTVVKVQLEGACSGCSVNQMTLKNGVEATIKKYAPQIKQVINID